MTTLLRLVVWWSLLLAASSSLQLGVHSKHLHHGSRPTKKGAPESIFRAALHHGNQAKRSDQPTSEVFDQESNGMGGFLQFKEAPPKYLEARQHGKTVLECSAAGSPAPKITWFKDGRPMYKETSPTFLTDFPSLATQSEQPTDESLAETISHLTLDCVSESDAGFYQCIAYNDLGEKRSVGTEVTVASYQSSDCSSNDLVQLPPKIYLWIGTYMQTIGARATLPCATLGKYETEWFGPDEKPIENGHKYKVLPNGDLVVASLSFEDMGMFRCMAHNENGHDMKETFVYPLAPMKK